MTGFIQLRVVGVFAAFQLALLFQCPSASAQQEQRVTPVYATGFSVAYHRAYTLATVTRPWPAAQVQYRYVLVPRGEALPADIPHGPDTTIVRVPVYRVVTMSTTFLTPLEELGVLDTLRGHSQTRFVYSPPVRRLIAGGQVAEVGSGSTLNVERLVEIHPDVIFANRYGSEWDAESGLRQTGLPVVVLGDWAERNPLGAAEWIKFLSLFFGKEETANAVFDRIASRYRELKLIAAEAPTRPTVFSNAPYQGQWTVPGGGSYAARLFADAGARYIWANTATTGSLTLDFESVFYRAHDADFWLNTGTWTSLSDGLRTDPRVSRFAAFATDHVFNNNAKVGPGGGVAYYESGMARPDRVLADLIRIFHPEELKGHELYYYQRLH